VYFERAREAPIYVKENHMKRIIISSAIGLAAAAFVSTAFAVDAARAQDEAKEHGCLKCHDIDKKKVGPGYKDISAKMKGKKVEEGMAAMKAKPVHKSVLQKTSDSSLKEIMEWVLSL
jgi:cytochrome c